MSLIPLTIEQEDAVFQRVGYPRTKLEEDLVEIRTWLAQQNHLPPCRNRENDKFLTNYLVGCKGKISSCKKKLDAYYTMRSQYTHLFENRNPENLAPSLKYLEAMTLPNTTEDGSRVSAAILTNSSKFCFESCLKRVILVLEIRLRTEAIYGGDYVIADVMNFTTKHICKISLPLFHQFVQFVLKGVPSRLKGIIFYNTSYIFEFGVNRFLKPALKSHIASRIFMYSRGKECLVKHFEPSILPKEMGGPTLEIKLLSDYWMEEGLAWKEWFLNEGCEMTDETKRPKAVKSSWFSWGSHPSTSSAAIE